MPVQSHGVRVCEEREKGRKGGKKKEEKRETKRECGVSSKKIYIYIYKKVKKKKSENSSGMPDFHCDFSLFYYSGGETLWEGNIVRAI